MTRLIMLGVGLCGAVACKSGLKSGAITEPPGDPRGVGPKEILIVSGDSQVGRAGGQLPAPLVVRVLDSLNQPAPAVPVRWQVGLGTLADADTETDAYGRANAIWTLGSALGGQTASVTGSALNTITFHSTAVGLVQLQLTPASVTVAPGGTTQFSVRGILSDRTQETPTATYTVSAGSITASGLFRAPSSTGAVLVVAAADGLADTSVVNVIAPTANLVSLRLFPESVTLPVGATQQFSAVGTMSDSSQVAPNVTYTATGGSISADGVYRAGSTPGVFRVTAVQQGGTLADTSTVTLTVAGKYDPPDLLDWTFENGLSPSTPFGEAIPVVRGDAATTDGSYSAYSNWPNGSRFEESPGWIFYGQDHGGTDRTDIWIRWAHKQYNAYTGSGATGQKINRIYSSSGGDHYVSSLGQTNGRWIYDFGSTSYQPTLTNIPAPGSSGFAFGTWHWFEIHFHLERGQPATVDIYFDGELNPRHHLVSPSNRTESGFGAYYEIYTTLNGPFDGPYAFKVDDVAYSTTRIGLPPNAKIGVP